MNNYEVEICSDGGSLKVIGRINRLVENTDYIYQPNWIENLLGITLKKKAEKAYNYRVRNYKERARKEAEIRDVIIDLGEKHKWKQE